MVILLSMIIIDAFSIFGKTFFAARPMALRFRWSPTELGDRASADRADIGRLVAHRVEHGLVAVEDLLCAHSAILGNVVL